MDDPDAPRSGMTARVYLEIFADELPTLIDHTAIFIQDNARIHITKVVREWLTTMSFDILKYSIYSPDLNPIENLGKVMKERIIRDYPELIFIPSNTTSKALL